MITSSFVCLTYIVPAFRVSFELGIEIIVHKTLKVYLFVLSNKHKIAL